MKKGKYGGQVNKGCRIVEIACCADCCSCTEVAELNGEYYCQMLLESIPKMFVSCDFLDDCPLPNAQQYIKDAQGTSTNSAMVPCHSWECAGYNCWIINGRYCKDKPCLVMAQHQ
jgi:hypothetical protein